MTETIRLAPLIALPIRFPPEGESHHLIIFPEEIPERVDDPEEQRRDGDAVTVGLLKGATVTITDILGLPEQTLKDSA